ncbi:hypothetical protein C0992_008483, partial [Termitomyces sp. T32_za158]
MHLTELFTKVTVKRTKPGHQPPSTSDASSSASQADGTGSQAPQGVAAARASELTITSPHKAEVGPRKASLPVGPAAEGVRANNNDGIRTLSNVTRTVCRFGGGVFASTPVQPVFSAAVGILDLQNNIVDNQDSLDELINLVHEILEVVNSAMTQMMEMRIDRDFNKRTTELYKFLVEKRDELVLMKNKSFMRRVLENEQDKAKILSIKLNIKEKRENFR